MPHASFIAPRRRRFRPGLSDIAGQGISSPVGATASAALMLDHLGLPGAARRLEAAVESVTAAGVRTRDVGGTAGTAEVTDAVIEALQHSTAADGAVPDSIR